MKIIFAKKMNLKMKEVNELKWEKVKKDKNLLPEFNKLRKKFVDELLKLSIKKTKCNDCIVTVAGSVDLTSDYDITLNSLNTSSKVAEIFNDLFIKIWNNTSTEVFDTNLYGIGFFLETPKDVNKKIFNQFTFKNKKYIYLNCPKVKKECINDTKIQREIAIMQFFKQEELSNLKMLNKKIFIKDYLKYKNKYKNLTKDINIKNIKQTNKKYIKNLKQIELLKKDEKNVENIIKYKTLISETMFYGNETYLTQGAFFHVVGIIQMKIPFISKIITQEEILDSIIENYSYLIMEYGKSKNIYNFISLSSKYIYRILDGVIRYNKNNEYVELKKNIINLKKYRTLKKFKMNQKIEIDYLLTGIGIKKFTLEDMSIETLIRKITKFIKIEINDFPFTIKK